MKTDEEIFSIFLQQHYPEYMISRPLREELVDIKEIQDTNLAGYNLIEPDGTFYLKKTPRIIFDFFIHSKIGAFAGKDLENGSFVLGISETTMWLLRMLFDRMMGEPRLFTWIGDPTKEDQQHPPSRLYYDFKDVKIDEVKVYTRDLVRRSYVNMLTSYAIHYIFNHELSHIIFGHIDFSIETANCNCQNFSENWIASKDTSRLLDQQCLEISADCTAIGRVAAFFMDIMRTRELQPPSIAMFLQDPIEVVTDIYIAVLCTLELHIKDKFKPTLLGYDVHPEHGLRQYFAMATVSNLCEILNLDAISTSKRLIEKLNECELAFEIVTGLKRQSWNANLLDECDPFRKTFEAHWKESLRERLSPFAYKSPPM